MTHRNVEFVDAVDDHGRKVQVPPHYLDVFPEVFRLTPAGVARASAPAPVAPAPEDAVPALEPDKTPAAGSKKKEN